MKLKILNYIAVVASVFALSSIAMAAPPQGYVYNPDCDLGGSKWHTSSPKGVTNGTNGECKFGLEYPSFNAFRNSQYLKPGEFANQFEFAWVRLWREFDFDYLSLPLQGYQNSVTLKSDDDRAQARFYVHNSGRPDCNLPSDSSQLAENGCIRSTIAKNVTFKLDGLVSSGEYMVSNGIDSGNSRTHNLNATISSSNTTPPSLSDGFNIITQSDKAIRAPKNSPVSIIYCAEQGEVNSQGFRDCEDERTITRTLEQLSNGISLNNVFSGNGESGFFASEGYVLNIFAFFAPFDAPDEKLVCEGITATRIAGTDTSTTQTYRVRFTPNETEFHQAINVTGAQSTSNFVDPTVGRKYTDVTFTNLSPNATATITSQGNGSDCATQISFPDIPGPRICRELNLLEIGSTEDSVTFEVQTTPSDFANTANVTAANGTIEELTNNRYRLTGISEATKVNASIPDSEQGSENCLAEKDFTPEPPVSLVCESITLNTNTYNYKENSRPTFRVTEKTPAEFEADFRWQVLGANGQVTQTQTASNLTSFRPNSPLTGNESITVNVINSNEPNCRGEITSELPPVEEVCEDLDIIRILNPQLRRTIPNNGQPAIFQLDGGQFEGQITFQAEGEPNQTVFITNDQRTRGSITVDIDETVIILNTGVNNTLRVFAQEQNANTINCNLVLTADSDDDGDKLTRINKSVDKAFATDGDILTYTIEYTISKVFGNPNFQEALEGLDTAILKDNIKSIYGIQDKLINPLESRDSSLQVLELAIDSRLRGSSGDLFGNDGLVIENLTEKAGNTYRFTYTARLESDILEECQIISDSCGFEFPNTASDNFGNSDTASVLATCPFVVSRSFGDVFLEEGFEGTIDIARCTNKRNTEGPVFTPKERTPQELISSGSGAFSAPTHRICRESISANPNLTGRELEGYNNPLENFSSSVCEVSLFTSSSWTSEDIERNLRSNASRFNNVSNLNGVNSLESLNGSALTTYDSLNPNSDTKVYRKTNGDLTINADSEIFINDGVAKTIIVEGHDLIINQNIKYQVTNQAFPSQIAFIVIGGDVVVSPEVTHMIGAIAAVPDADGNGGFIRRVQDTNKLLTIRGSIFGDSGPLFAGTSNPGNLLADQGAVTVIYDSGIILNTPPGLQSIIQFNQYQTVR